MPLPKTKDVGKIMKELKKSKTERPHKQMVAIALNQARKEDANMPKKKHTMSTSDGYMLID